MILGGTKISLGNKPQKQISKRQQFKFVLKKQFSTAEDTNNNEDTKLDVTITVY
jgi:hypothetical protein